MVTESVAANMTSGCRVGRAWLACYAGHQAWEQVVTYDRVDMLGKGWQEAS